MIAVALWVTSLPGAVGRIAAFGTGPLLLGSAGLIVLGLLKSPLRLTGAVLMTIASLWALRTPQPDVLVAPDGTSFAVRTATGRLAILKTGSDIFATRDWLSADADARAVKDKALGEGLACDDAGCIGRLADGSLVAIARTIEAFEEDCRRAALVVSAREAPPDCATRVIDRKVWQRNGALALHRVGTSWEITAARPPATIDPGRALWRRRKTLLPQRLPLRHDRRHVMRRQIRTILSRKVIRNPADEFGLLSSPRKRDDKRLIPPEQPNQLALDAHTVGRQDAHLVGGVGGLECDRGAAAAEALQGGLLLVDQRHHDVAGVGRFGSAQQRDIAVEDAGIEHAVATHFEREVLARAQHLGRHVDDLSLALDRSIGVPAAMRPSPAGTGRLPSSSSPCARGRVALDHTRREPARASGADAVGDRVRQLDHLNGARPVGQAANEAALLERGDEPMDSGFRTQVERVLHLIEGGRHARFLEPLMDEAKKLKLLAGQHLVSSPGSRSRQSGTQPKQIMNGHYPFHMCSATI
jgi:hypothetical protein